MFLAPLVYHTCAPPKTGSKQQSRWVKTRCLTLRGNSFGETNNTQVGWANTVLSSSGSCELRSPAIWRSAFSHSPLIAQCCGTVPVSNVPAAASSTPAPKTGQWCAAYPTRAGIKAELVSISPSTLNPCLLHIIIGLLAGMVFLRTKWGGGAEEWLSVAEQLFPAEIYKFVTNHDLSLPCATIKFSNGHGKISAEHRASLFPTT